MFTRLLRLLDGGQNESLWKLLRSDLKVIGLLFGIAIGLSLMITAFSPESPIDSGRNDSQSLSF